MSTEPEILEPHPAVVGAEPTVPAQGVASTTTDPLPALPLASADGAIGIGETPAPGGAVRSSVRTVRKGKRKGSARRGGRQVRVPAPKGPYAAMERLRAKLGTLGTVAAQADLDWDEVQAVLGDPMVQRLHALSGAKRLAAAAILNAV